MYSIKIIINGVSYIVYFIDDVCNKQRICRKCCLGFFYNITEICDEDLILQDKEDIYLEAEKILNKKCYTGGNIC